MKLRQKGSPSNHPQIVIVQMTSTENQPTRIFLAVRLNAHPAPLLAEHVPEARVAHLVAGVARVDHRVVMLAGQQDVLLREVLLHVSPVHVGRGHLFLQLCH